MNYLRYFGNFDALSRGLSNEKGSALVLGSFLLAVSLMFAGLAVDGSHAFLQRRQMQTAADAAALAGIHLIAHGADTSAVDAEIQAIANMNGADRIEWSLQNDSTAIEVVAHRTIGTYFAGIINVTSLSVSATATTGLFPISSASRLLPMTLHCDDVAGFVPGQIYDFWQNSASNKGNFGWLDWNGGAASSLQLSQHIADVALSGERHIGEWVDGSSGVDGSSAVRSTLDSWIGQSVMIALHDAVDSTGNNLQYRLCGFVRFTLTGYDFNGSNKRVEGMFEYSTYRGSAGVMSTDNFGTYVVKIIE